MPHLHAHAGAGGPEAGLPARRVEADRGGGGHALEELAGRRGGQHGQGVGAGEGGVGEVHHLQVGAFGLHEGGHQAEVVVLHEHRGPLGRGFVHDGGEEPVELPVGVPGPEPAVVEAGPARQVEEVMVQEPQRGVRHHVVGHAVGVLVGLDRHEAQAPLGHEPLGGGPPIGVGHGARHPGGAAPLELGMQGGGQPARRTGRDRSAVVVQGERQRTAVGGDHEVRAHVPTLPPRLQQPPPRATMAT